MNLRSAIRVGFKNVADKLGGLAKDIAGSIIGDQSLHEEGLAQIDQAHVEPEVAAIEAEDDRRRQDGVLRRVRKL